MRVWPLFFKAPFRVIHIANKRMVLRLRQQMIGVKLALSQEKTETKEMLVIYRKYTLNQANKEEMQAANKQFRDIIKGLGIGVFAVLPFAPITIPFVIKLGQWVGVDILPSSFAEISLMKKARKKNQENPPK